MKSVISIFFSIVFVLFVCLYPDKLVEMMQMFIDAAYGMAHALGHLQLPTIHSTGSTPGN